MPDMTPQQLILQHREKVIQRLAYTAEQLLTDPHAAATGKMDAVSAVLQDELGVYEKWVLAYHSSSSSQYAMRDIPHNEKEPYERAKHMVRLLRQLYSPQDASPA